MDKLRKICKAVCVILIILIFAAIVALIWQYSADRAKEGEMKKLVLREVPGAAGLFVSYRKRPLARFEVRLTAPELTPEEAVRLVGALNELVDRYDEYTPIPDNWVDLPEPERSRYLYHQQIGLRVAIDFDKDNRGDIALTPSFTSAFKREGLLEADPGRLPEAWRALWESGVK